MPYLIRDADTSDIPLLAEIVRTSFLDVAHRFELTGENASKHPSNCTQEWIVSEMEKGIRYFVLEAHGAPCGCVAVEHAKPKLCYLERLCVLPNQRGCGFGTALVNNALKTCSKQGAEFVQIGIISSDTRLKQWYESLGFRETHSATFAHLPFEVSFMVNVLKETNTG